MRQPDRPGQPGKGSRPDEEEQPVCLGDLTEQNLAVFCWCHGCGHSRLLDSARLAGLFGPRFPVPSLAGHIRCSQCGSKQASTRPAWPAWGGQIARHE